MIDKCEDREAGNPFPKLLTNLKASAEEAQKGWNNNPQDDSQNMKILSEWSSMAIKMIFAIVPTTVERAKVFAEVALEAFEAQNLDQNEPQEPNQVEENK